MSGKTVASELASAIVARRNCLKSGNTEWLDRWTDRINTIMDSAPSGSGFNYGVSVDWDASGFDKLVFFAPFHHMDENGSYDGWTDHTVTVRPAFHVGMDVTVSGRNGNDFKDYCADLFGSWLSEAIVEASV